MKIYYRISDAGYKKVKAPYINNENCLKNFVTNFCNCDVSIMSILADNVSNATYDMIKKYIPENQITKCSKGSGAATFNVVLTEALNLDDKEIVYFVENDYMHRKNSKHILDEGFSIGSDYVALYDHPDKYLNADQGGNPFIEGGGEITKVFLSKSCHWKLTNSTTMTFASTVKTLKDDESIFRKWTTQSYPEDFRIFIDLREKGKTLITPLPSYSTHGDLPWMAPLIDWEEEYIKLI